MLNVHSSALWIYDLFSQQNSILEYIHKPETGLTGLCNETRVDETAHDKAKL